jgi:predicted DCC family thiol-disulfide oxidoreductase YuxK
MAENAAESLPVHSENGFPDPDAHPDADVVIYDGDCNFCIGQVKNLRRLDCCGGRLSYLSLHDPRVKDRYPDLTHDQLMAQMYIVDQQGRRHGGGDAVRYLSRRLPLLWIFAPILHLPGTANLWRWGYHQIAKRRYKLAGKKSNGPSCESDSCAVHLGDPS